MAFKLSLNENVLNFKETNLPCLIQYQEGSGGSQFSVTLIADLFLHGSKIVFLTAYPMAKNNFMEQIAGSESKIKFVANQQDLKDAGNYQSIIIKSGDGDLYQKALETLGDIDERILFVKNIEFFDNNILDATLMFKKILIAGDIDKCVAKDKITNKQFSTIVAFSKSVQDIHIDTPKLEKYSGYLKSESKEGIVKIDMN